MIQFLKIINCKQWETVDSVDYYRSVRESVKSLKETHWINGLEKFSTGQADYFCKIT